MSPTLPLSETFTSIQGEGKLAGTPSFFIRLSGCNLRCAWCDTPYASWSPESTALSIDEIVEQARASNTRHAVLTGGEPMMFPALPDLAARLAAPVENAGSGMHITIETAGTIIPPQVHAAADLPCHLMSISPKLSTSTPINDPRDPLRIWAARHEERRLNIPVLQRLIDLYPAPAHQLKFVVSAPPDLGRDLAEILALLARLRNWRPEDVLLMPEGVAMPAAEHRAAIVRACLDHGFRYCARLHIELFGNTRGT